MIKEKIVKLKDNIVNNKSFTVKEQLGYSGGILGNTMGQDMATTYTKKFIQNYGGISPNQVGKMESVKTIIDLIANPFMGAYFDRPAKDNKLSPTKKVLKYMPIPFALTSMLLFIVPSGNSELNFIWFLALWILFGLVDAFYDMSLNVMSLRMTDNANDRRNFFTVATFMAALGSMLPGYLLPVFKNLGRTDNQKKWIYFFYALFFCIIGVSAMLAPYFTLNEKIKPQDNKKHSIISWDKQTMSAILHNPTFFIIQLGNFFEKVRACSYELLVYVYEDVFGNLGMKIVIDVLSGTLSYVGLGFVPYLCSHFSSSMVMTLSYTYTGIFYTIMGLFGLGMNLDRIRKYRWVIGILICFAGLPNNALSAAKKDIVADSSDYMEWYSYKKFKTPIRSEGLIFTVQNIFTAVSTLIVTKLLYGNLSVAGYQVNAVVDGANEASQSSQTLTIIFAMFALFGIIGNFLAAITYLFNKYRGSRREQILEELKSIRAQRETVANEE